MRQSFWFILIISVETNLAYAGLNSDRVGICGIAHIPFEVNFFFQIQGSRGK